MFPLIAENLVVEFNGKHILGPLDLTVNKGDISLILGPNGSGKTTLLKSLHGIMKLKRGSIKWSCSDKSSMQKQMFVFQTPIMLRRSVLENLTYPLLLRKISNSKAHRLATEWAEKIGLKETVIKSGKFKDIGSPIRDMTPEESKMLQDIIDETYQQFFNVVENTRHIPVDKLKEIAQGQVYTGIQAKKLGLVDENGNFQFVVDMIKKDLNLKGKPNIITHSVHRSFLSNLLSEKAGIEKELSILKNLKPMKLQYIMQP
jgi:nucleoside-triphosphatase THEP1